MIKNFLKCSLLFLLLVLSSCSFYKSASEYENVKWICEKPEIEFGIYSKEENGNGYLIVDGTKKDIICLWQYRNSNARYLEILSKDMYI